jgi:hypothetical protein
MDNVAAADVIEAVHQLKDAVLVLSAVTLLASGGAERAGQEALDLCTSVVDTIRKDIRR